MKKVPSPVERKLRGYAVDPSYSIQLSTLDVNELVYEVPWEDLEPRPTTDLGVSYPVGEYLEIVDYDPASKRFYAPVDLDEPYLLAQDGYAPSVSNPQFHQQMVYAVMMTTINNFEKALGRKILWGENILQSNDPDSPPGARTEVKFEFVRRLRVYPHALRQANAFYDPNRKALLFGYFTAAPANAQLQLPAGTVFTCLSHDIIAHETTHALLDGLHRRYIRATHPDTRAFHEAFADLVALFQHFSFPEVLKQQIALTRGDLRKQNILGQLAQQFGKATGSYGSLRDAIGSYDDDGNWNPTEPNPDEYLNVMSVHARGSILVAAVFDAFLNVYQHRIQKLLRIASGGTGILPDGELHPDLVDELADKAADTAQNFLRICVRALDYCPPMDITFGDYLRAIVTADYDMVADDSRGYRVAFVEAFQKRGISAAGIKSMAVEELIYPRVAVPKREQEQKWTILLHFLRDVKREVGYLTEREEIYERLKRYASHQSGGLIHRMEVKFARSVAEDFSALTGLLFPENELETVRKGLEFGYLTKETASFVVGNIWLANRVSPNGKIVNHVIVTLIQKRGVRFNVDRKNDIVEVDGFFVPENAKPEEKGEYNISFNGGCTLIFDLDEMKVRYAIRKDIDDEQRMIRQFRYENGMLENEHTDTYFGAKSMADLSGPFAFMHSHDDELE